MTSVNRMTTAGFKVAPQRGFAPQRPAELPAGELIASNAELDAA
jgi:hypothetical protein